MVMGAPPMGAEECVVERGVTTVRDGGMMPCAALPGKHARQGSDDRALIATELLGQITSYLEHRHGHGVGLSKHDQEG